MASAGNSRIVQDPMADTEVNPMPVIIVRTQWNPEIIDALEKGCVNTLRSKGFDHIRVLSVPGAVEIPFAVNQCWNAYKYRDDRPGVFIVLGCVIKGDTPHFDYVCNMVSEGVTALNLSLPVPTIFGVLTVLNQDQAWERLGGVHGHKGEEAAHTAISMISLSQSLMPRRLDAH
jgi:6,7-dimethyl-8-ribityllumazine synthase